MSNCLFCYKPLSAGEADFHVQCSKKFFGSSVPPEQPFPLHQLMDLALESLGKSVSVTGVQPKIFLGTKHSSQTPWRITLANVLGNYILKPPVEQYPEMPEIEDLTMHLAQLLKIKTAEHSLFRLQSGELAYVTKRFDRKGEKKIPVEDMAKLTGTLTENKYRGSMEEIAKTIKAYSSYELYDLISLYELTLFAFITGNADMHLKNFSLLTNEYNEVQLAPAYDLLSTKLLIPGDQEELALPMNGKKSKLKKHDFEEFAKKIGLSTVMVNKVHSKFFRQANAVIDFVGCSFISKSLQTEFVSLIKTRFSILSS